MPRATPTPVKNMKMKSIKDFFSPKETESNHKSRKVLQNVNNVENAEGKSHQFQFRYKKVTYAVACDPSKTVLEALNTNQIFKKIMNENVQKEIILQRSKGDVPQAAVKTDFPCCLTQEDEIMDVSFIKKHDTACSQKKKPTRRPSLFSRPENMVTFYIKTKGKGKVMVNKELWKNDVDYVCVYAFDRETLREALKHDGRFNADIFKKSCVLSEFGSGTIHDMTHPVKHLHRKHFLMVTSGNKNPSDSQSDGQDDAKENADPNPPPVSTEDDKKPNHVPKRTPRPAPKLIPGSKEFQKVLRDDMRRHLEQERVGNSLQKFFRTEFDKGVGSFSEVKKVKEIMRLSSSVCQIRMEGCARGTGFLLFDRFILTNAHVIEDFDPFTRKLFKAFTAVFGFEDLDQEVKSVAVKEQAAAYYYGDDDMKRHLDFALLELDVHEALGFPELLAHYRHGRLPTRGGVCIVGHPDGGVKRMDPCFIISREDQQEAVNKHMAQNVNYYHVITQQSLEQKWERHDHQITYDSCFFHGSSGSPVFDECCRLIGVHTGGYVYRRETGKARSVMEYGFSIRPILENILKQAKSNARGDILKPLCLHMNMEDGDVEMTEEPHQEESEQ